MRIPQMLATVLSASAIAAAAGLPLDPVNKSRGVAIHGYDVVAYADAKGPIKGRDEFAHLWQGAQWLFSTETNRDRFKAEPVRYVPQYGGYCAYAVSRGKTADIDPEAWTIRDGKLYLNYNKKIRTRWLEAVDDNIAKADANWPELLAE